MITGTGIPTGTEERAPGSYGPVCSQCPVRSGCLKICDLVENVIPSMEKGRVDAEDLPRLYMGIRTVNVLLENTHLLTDRQQQVVQLYYREAMQQQEIAQRLKVTQQAVADALVRARRAVGKHFGNRELARNTRSGT
ncbi:MAG: sigma factor-like helix-turn-helix DNA-binding protein [Planctomycetota bacterium]